MVHTINIYNISSMYIKYAYNITKTHIVTQKIKFKRKKRTSYKNLFHQYIGRFNQTRTVFYAGEQDIELTKFF